MARQTNAAPVIIKRKKVVAGGGHHGGAWKVAYADFVTAMMAFFLLMWLLGATTEKQRKGVADYFSPAIPISPQSGGGSGAFRGDNALSAEDLAYSGKSQSVLSAEDILQRQAAAQAQKDAVDKQLTALAGESMTMEQALRHVVTKVTDEGLVIEIFDLPQAPLFQIDSAEPQDVTRNIAPILADVLAVATNQLAVNGHVHSYPITMIDNPAWSLSSARAAAMRDLLTKAGLERQRFQRFSGFADRKPVTADPTAIRNNRIELVLLRWDR
ncbi:flagellar motor protein MotB [Neogemmobacter tilapiae]|uniref:Chemotaxis MotB protein n=1 Tax=Neogemmobacter tilapiae TaxID=875041 RepID=A0A918TK76_9RHOB|nr:flagellar motor protein MotB [Gemmobacter tilapiae]GHC51859.1 chemotaxis MotB protein [Gemmobacter tilapiae]